MKLWIWSDLHHEMQKTSLPSGKPKGVDAIVCAGDLCRAPDLSRLAREIVDRYQVPLIFVPGNHEFYSRSSNRSKPHDHALMQQAQKESYSWSHRLYVLDDNEVELGGVRFVGGTLWTDFLLGGDLTDLPWRLNSARWLLSDFAEIRMQDRQLLTPQAMLDFNRVTHEFIERQLAIPFDGKTVVVTHHVPHPAATPAIYKSDDANFLFTNSHRAFGDILDSDRAPALWVCGHTHHPVDVTVGNTRVVCNPHGYNVAPDERENGFRWDLVIDMQELP